MLVELLRNKPWLRRTLSGISVLLVLGGLALVGYPFATNMWTDRIQERLDDQIASPELQQAYKERKIETGDSLTRIKIPALGLDTVVVEGVTPSALRAGAGHYPQTPLPCETGNVSIAGHRTTYGRPFGNVDQLKPGDTIELTTPIGGCVYQVSRDPWVVAPSEMSVIDPTAERSLTLTTCHPKGSAAQRLIVRATWVKDLKAA
ncbi:MAG TPA: class E sortase [Acidimicrobiales bacterium]|nr:class E sortase [Acidimicrobiales bacterium]HWI02526.1 class E sortase [Acidimicrobiales bacterium]